MTRSSDIAASVEWESPSNLAIVKYWGKQRIQEPLNPSISFSLKNAVTRTKVSAQPADEPGFSFTLDGVKKDSFNEKVEVFLEKARPYLPFLRKHHLTIESTNTFPHSSGIASSASSMSALALCLTELHNISLGKESPLPDPVMASGLARLGSGSACRSIFGGWTLWGKYAGMKESTDMYAMPVADFEIADDFKNIQDAILLIDPSRKKVSSSAGHELMDRHPYKEARIDQAHQHTQKLLEILKSGNWAAFFEITENEALTLHGLMMNSSPSFTLLHPRSLEAIAKIREARTNDGITVGFSMDAGPNIHLLYPQWEEARIRPWIEHTLAPLCADGQVLYDMVGSGPVKL
jgi:diphosphomevalonate decarboxylase